MTAMTIERAVDNAIVSTEMEGFVITEKHKELIMKLMKMFLKQNNIQIILKACPMKNTQKEYAMPY